MMKDPKIFVDHILERVERVEEYMKGVTKGEFLNSIQLQHAVIRRIEIIGEATKRVSTKMKDRYIHIPWKQTTGMGDILIP